MNNASFEFNRQLELDVLLNGLTEISEDYVLQRIKKKLSELDEIVIPDSVTSIGTWTFFDCSGLTSVTIPDSVTSIGKHAFAWCDSLNLVFKGKTIDKVRSMKNYPWGIRNPKKISVQVIPDLL